MFVGSRFCARCGAEATREHVEEATAMNCPRCGESLQALRLGAMPAHECAACGGVWLDPGTFQKLCDDRDEHAGVASVLEGRMPTKPVTPDAVKYLFCPQCKKLMNRVNFAHTSGVITDVCKEHGVWLDRGELQRVMAFVEHGGLAAMRQHQIDQLDDERRRLEQERNQTSQLANDFRRRML
jgi:Zn-finger nucleic acid-binding protein